MSPRSSMMRRREGDAHRRLSQGAAFRRGRRTEVRESCAQVMKNRFDRAGKDLVAEALAPRADVATGVETSPDPQSIDVWSVPKGAPSSDLDLLGRIALEPCIIELYSGTVRLEEVRDCLRKQLGRHHELQNQDRARWRSSPHLWILSTGRPEAALELGFERAVDWPPGVYRLAPVWNAFLVVRSELPRERATLTLRANGAGRVLKEAVEDLLREPEDSTLRAMLVKHLARLVLELKQNSAAQSPEEREFAMTGEQLLRELETKARESGLEEGLEEGHESGLEEGLRGARSLVRLAYEQRFGPIPTRIDEALGRVRDIDDLRHAMTACLTKTEEEVARSLGAGVQ